MFNLNGKKALITGSTQGIGLAMAKAFVKSGAKVIVHCSNDLKKAEQIAKEINAHSFCTYDLSENNPQELYAKTGDVDILVLNASVQYRTAWDKIEDGEFDSQINVNFKSTLKLMQRYYPFMAQNKWGRILTIGSVQQYVPHKDMAVYAATKCAVMSLVKNTAKQLADKGITVNNLSPGVIATPRNLDALADKKYCEKLVFSIPAGFVGSADDCAGAAVFLCSDAARYVTGIDLVVDGGMSL